MAWISATASPSSKHRGSLRFVRGLALLAGLCLASPAIAESEGVLSLESPIFGKAELAEIGRALGIQVGKPLDPRRLDDGIRELYRAGRVQNLWVETTPSGKGLKVVLRGAKLRKLRKISFKDIDLDLYEDLRRQLPLEEGEIVDNRTLTLLKERIKEGYEAKGYYFTEVDVLLYDAEGGNETDIDVVVKPNEPSIVSKIVLQGGPKEEMEALRGVISLKKGNAYTKAALDESIEAVSRYLKNNQYPTSKVESTNVSFSEDKKSVEIAILVSLGDKFQFQFNGNTVFSDVNLRDLLNEEMLSHSDGSGRVAELIEKKYRGVGYHFVKVETKNLKSDVDRMNIVRFEIAEGPKVIIDRVEFRQTDSKLERLAERLFYRDAPGIIARKIYWEEGLDEAVRNLKRALEAEGFLSAGISPPKSIFSEDRKGVQLIFDADLGIRTFVSQVVFQGTSQVPEEELRELIALEPGEPLDREKVKKARKKILEYYTNQGYLEAKFAEGDPSEGISIASDQKSATVLFNVTENGRFYIGKVRVQGNRKTKDEVLLREMRLAPGDVYDPTLIQKSEEDINLLGLFSRAEIVSTPSEDANNRKDLTIVVRESKPGFGEVGFGGVYEEPRLRLRTFFGIAYRNLMGLNHTATARTEISLPITRDNPNKIIPFVEYATLLGYRAPYPFSLPFTYSLLVGLDSFEVSTVGPVLQTRARIENRIERKLSDHLTGIYRLHRYERTRTETMASSATTASSKIDTIGSTGPGLIFDLRDDIFNPTKGSLHTADFELAHPVLLSQTDPQRIGFIMASTRNSFYFPLISPFSLSVFGGLGYAKSILPGSPLPTARLTYDLSLGGQNSIRGFSVRRFSPANETDPNNNPTSSAFYNLRTELTIYLFSSLSAAVFWDTGQIYPNLRPEPRHDGVGIGFRYKTPVGPVVIDVAQGLGQDKESIKFYFTVGTF